VRPRWLCGLEVAALKHINNYWIFTLKETLNVRINGHLIGCLIADLIAEINGHLIEYLAAHLLFDLFTVLPTEDKGLGIIIESGALAVLWKKGKDRTDNIQTLNYK